MFSPRPTLTATERHTRQPRHPHSHGDRATPRHGLRPRAPRYHHQGRRPGIQDLDTTAPETRRYPNQRDEWKGRSFTHPWTAPGAETQRAGPKKASITRPAAPGARQAQSCCQARDEVGPTVGRETSSVLLPGARRALSCCRARDELCLAATGARRAMDRNWERSRPMTRVEPGRRGKESKVKKGRSLTPDAGGDQPPP